MGPVLIRLNGMFWKPMQKKKKQPGTSKWSHGFKTGWERPPQSEAVAVIRLPRPLVIGFLSDGGSSVPGEDMTLECRRQLALFLVSGHTALTPSLPPKERDPFSCNSRLNPPPT